MSKKHHKKKKFNSQKPQRLFVEVMEKPCKEAINIDYNVQVGMLVIGIIASLGIMAWLLLTV